MLDQTAAAPPPPPPSDPPKGLPPPPPPKDEPPAPPPPPADAKVSPTSAAVVSVFHGVVNVSFDRLKVNIF